MVAIVVSSETMLDQLQDDDGKYHSEHAVSPPTSMRCLQIKLTSSPVTPIPPTRCQPLDNLYPNPHLQSTPVDRQDSTSRPILHRLVLRRHQHTRPNSRRGTHLSRPTALHTNSHDASTLCPLVRRRSLRSSLQAGCSYRGGPGQRAHLRDATRLGAHV
jgi:hypothetical protein